MARSRLSLILAAAALTLSACLDDPAVRERLGVDEQGRPIGASVAPASPEASPGASPAASAEASATPAPSASPSVLPGATGRYVKTFDPLDVAVAGPGYLVIARRPDPQGFSDVMFTRLGELDLVYVASGSPAPGPAPGPVTVVGPGEWRLQTRDGLHVLGYGYGGEEGAAAPSEMRSTSFQSAFMAGGTASVGAIAVDTQSNLNFAPHFNFKGQLLSQQKPPLDPDGRERQVYLAIAQFERPSGLKRVTGFPAYEYTPDAGVVSVGIAGVTTPQAGVPRPVGDANLIRPETLER